MRLVILLAVALAVPAAAQDDTFDGRILAVTGTGEVRSRSDRAVLQIAFETEGETAEEALRQHEAEVERVRQLLRDQGVPDDRVSVDHASVAPAGAMGFPGASSDGDGYSVSRQLTVEVDDLDTVPSLVAALATDRDDGALEVQTRTVNVSYVLADPAPLRRQALREAVLDARARAELMAETVGVTLGEVLDVSEGAAAGGGEMGMFGAMMMEAMRAEMGGGGTAVEHSVGASVIVTYRIR